MIHARLLISFAVLTLLASGASRAQSGYNIQSLVNAGDTIAGVKLAPFNETDFGILGLNDNGELVFSALDTNGNRVLFDDNGGKFTRIAGEGDTIGGVVIHALSGGDGPTINGQTTFLGLDPNFNDLLFQYAGGKTTLIAATGTPAPGGQFDKGGLQITQPVSMNWQGNIVFGAGLTPTVPYPPGILHPTQPAVFRWDAAKQQLTTVAGPGTKLGDTTVYSAQGDDAPVINNNNEMVIDVDSAPAKPPYDHYEGLVFVGADGKLQPITQYGEKLPDGKTTTIASQPILNDAGVVAFEGGRNDAVEAYYLWDKATGSTVGPIITLGQDAGNGQKVARIEEVGLDPFTASGMIETRLDDSQFGRIDLYRFLTFEGKAGGQGASVAAAPARIASTSDCDFDFFRAYNEFFFYGALDPFGFLDWPYVQQQALECIKEDKDEGWIKSHIPPGGPTLPQIDDLYKALQAKWYGAIPAAPPPTGSAGPSAPSGTGTSAASAPSQAAIDAVWQQFGQVIANPFCAAGQCHPLAAGATALPGPFFSLATPGIFFTETASGAGTAYWIGPDGQSKLLLQDGMTTSVGEVGVPVYQLHWGSNGGWNDYYQVALVASVASGTGGGDAILLLTPTAAP